MREDLDDVLALAGVSLVKKKLKHSNSPSLVTTG